MSRILRDLLIVIILLAVEFAVLRFWLGEYYFQRGEYNVKINRPREAASNYMRAISFNSLEPGYHRRLGQAFHKIAEKSDTPASWLEKASEEFKAAICLLPEYPYFWADLGKVLEWGEKKGMKQEPGARECLARAVNLDPNNSYFLEIYSRYLLERGDIDSADEWIPKLIEIAPERTNAVAYLRVRYPGGFEFMEKSLDEKAEAFYQFAKLLDLYGKKGDAASHFQRAVAHAPEREVYRVTAAKFFLANKEPDQVLKLLKPILDRDDTMYFDAYDLAGIALVRMGREQEALQVFNRALEKNPRNLSIRMRLAEFYFKRERWDQAKQEYAMIIAHDFPLSKGLRTRVLYRLGKMHYQTGNREKARYYFEDYLKMNPGNKEVKGYMRELE